MQEPMGAIAGSDTYDLAAMLTLLDQSQAMAVKC
jgi:hypothetical protein